MSIRLNKPYHCVNLQVQVVNWYPSNSVCVLSGNTGNFFYWLLQFDIPGLIQFVLVLAISKQNTTFRSGRYLKHCLAHRRLFDIVVNQLMLGTKPWLRSNSSINNVTFACGLLAMFMASRTEGRGACCSAHPIRPMRLLVEMRKWPGISLKFTAIGASYVPGVDSHNDDDLLHKQCNSANIRPWPINNVILPTFARGLLAMFMASRTGCWIVFIHLLLHSY